MYARRFPAIIMYVLCVLVFPHSRALIYLNYNGSVFAMRIVVCLVYLKFVGIVRSANVIAVYT